MSEEYDSRNDTQEHIERVRDLLGQVSTNLVHRSSDCKPYVKTRVDRLREDLMSRAINHDQSKLEAPEKESFDVYTPKLKDTTYGSAEYQQFLDEMEPALEHHYAENRHHPEHFENGISDMTLGDVIEMTCDWKAASERHDDGCFEESCAKNEKRFDCNSDFAGILAHTFRSGDWSRLPGDRSWPDLVWAAVEIARTPIDNLMMRDLGGEVLEAVMHNTVMEYEWIQKRTPNMDRIVDTGGLVRCECGANPEPHSAGSDREMWYKCPSCGGCGPSIITVGSAIDLAEKCARHAWNDRRLKAIIKCKQFPPLVDSESPAHIEGGYTLAFPASTSESEGE